MQNVRKKLYVEPSAQGKLMRRVAVYWLGCFLFVSFPILFLYIAEDPSRLFFEHVPEIVRDYAYILMCVALLLPLLMLDMLRLSNQIAGPLFRMRRELEKLAEGQDVDPIVLRDGDEWQSLVDSFNRVAERIRSQEKVLRENDEHETLKV